MEKNGLFLKDQMVLKYGKENNFIFLFNNKYY